MADQIEAIERALAESTQKAIPIENDVSFDDYIKNIVFKYDEGSLSDQEKVKFLQTFKPSLLDSPEQKQNKLDRLSDDGLNVYMDLMGIGQGDMGPDLDSEQNYNLLERILQTLGLGRSVDETRLMEGSTPKQIQEYMNEQMQGTRGTLSDMKTQIMD